MSLPWSCPACQRLFPFVNDPMPALCPECFLRQAADDGSPEHPPQPTENLE